MEKFEITKEQVLKLHEMSELQNLPIFKKEIFMMFPDAFKTKFTGWAKDIHEMNKDWIAYYKNDILKYGINANGDWFRAKSNSYYNECESNREATEEEVKTALINEAKKRGYKEGVIIKDEDYEEIICNNAKIKFYENRNMFDYLGVTVFDNGKWATIIETITKEEAEKLLNKKII